MGKSKRLNGYWDSKEDPTAYIFVEKVFKKGHVTGFHYKRLPYCEVHSPLKISHEELQEKYTQR